mmetsp:Transcript_119260/g.283083  ORF Transcript_119260/g.283083 Transcript_119260/m.283083 type:complete len:202 (+) Transcript_119260:1037-1642(+)
MHQSPSSCLPSPAPRLRAARGRQASTCRCRKMAAFLRARRCETWPRHATGHQEKHRQTNDLQPPRPCHLPRHQCSHRARPCCPRPRCRSAPNRLPASLRGRHKQAATRRTGLSPAPLERRCSHVEELLRSRGIPAIALPPQGQRPRTSRHQPQRPVLWEVKRPQGSLDVKVLMHVRMGLRRPPRRCHHLTPGMGTLNSAGQ